MRLSRDPSVLENGTAAVEQRDGNSENRGQGLRGHGGCYGGGVWEK